MGEIPSWVSWSSNESYLPDIFYDPNSSLSLWSFTQWILSDPLTMNGDTLASYQQVELVVLGFRLAFRGLWIAQFPDNYADVPLYISASPYPFTEPKQLGYQVKNLISGFVEAYIPLSCVSNFFFRLMEITTAYPTNLVKLLKAHKEQQWGAMECPVQQS